MSVLKRVLEVTLFAFLLSPVLLGQGARGTITGVVLDTTGAVVPGVEVKITDRTSGVVRTAVTTDAGVYRAPYLPPSIYRIEATLPGFKTAVADNVEVRVAQVVNIDFTLEVGEVSEQIEVLATTPPVETATSQIGINTTDKEFHTWPLVSNAKRGLQSFIFKSLPGTEGGTFRGSINGGQAYSHEILVEGISVGRFDLTGGSDGEFSPSVEAVSEFKLQTGTLSAQYGATQTAISNFAMKSGTNEFHGSVYWFHNNKSLTANTWTNNALGSDKSAFLSNTFGGTIGGPILVPRYNGKDRTHFFFAYEGNRNRDQRTGTNLTLPVRAFKGGDFSALLDPAFTGDSRSGTVVGQDTLGRDVVFGQIYDPLTSRQLPDGTWIRDPFAGNILPTGRFSSVTQKILELADTPDPALNLFRFNQPVLGTCCPQLDEDLINIKVDHVISDKHKMSATYNDDDRRRFNGDRIRPGAYLPIPGSATSAWGLQATPGRMFRFSEDWTLSPTMLNHFALGYNRFGNRYQSAFFDEDWAGQFGLKNLGKATPPEILFGATSATLGGDIMRMGTGLTGDAPNGSWIVADDFSWMRGRHNLRFGLEVRRYYYNNRSSTSGGAFTFHSENTAQPGFVNASGFSYASFLLGAARQASLGIVATNPGQRVWYSAFYFQDDWKMTPSFTLNYGLRWEIPGAWREVVNRMSGFDPAVPNTGADGFSGSLVFMGDCPSCTGRDSFQETYYKQLAPRLGFAWNPKKDFVIRGGYGINYSAPLRNGFGFPMLHGFNGSNPVNPGSGRFAQDPSLYWDNGYPQFTDTLPNFSATQENGKGINYLPPESIRQPYVQTWNLGVQYLIPWNTVLELNYIGNKGTRLHDPLFAGFLNQVDSKHLALGDVLLDNIDKHPEISRPYPSFKGTVARALRPFPQYEGITAVKFHNGTSSYNSLQVLATKRMDTGLSFLAAYTFSKSLSSSESFLDGAGGQDFYNRENERSLVSFYHPHQFRLSWIYDLPWGRGRRWLNTGVLGTVIGGWTVSAVHQYQSGDALRIDASGFTGNALFNPGFRGDVLLPGDQQVIYTGARPDRRSGTPYLNPVAFGRPPSTPNGVALRFGTAPRFLPDVRGPALYVEDLAFLKRTPIDWGESTFFEIRVDISNVLNRAGTGNPITNISDSNFGKIFGNRFGPRQFQIGLKLSF